MSGGNSLSDEFDLSSVLGDTRAYLYSPALGWLFRAKRLLELEKIPTKVILDGLKRNMLRGNSVSDEVDLT